MDYIPPLYVFRPSVVHGLHLSVRGSTNRLGPFFPITSVAGTVCFLFPYMQFYIGVTVRHLDTVKLFAYYIVSRTFLSMQPNPIILMPGITES